MVVEDTGVYNFQFSAQIDNTAGGDQQVWIWARKDGTNVPDSASTLRIKGNDAEMVAAWDFMLAMSAGSYFELVWTRRFSRTSRNGHDSGNTRRDFDRQRSQSVIPTGAKTC